MQTATSYHCTVACFRCSCSHTVGSVPNPIALSMSTCGVHQVGKPAVYDQPRSRS